MGASVGYAIVLILGILIGIVSQEVRYRKMISNYQEAQRKTTWSARKLREDIEKAEEEI